MLNPMSAVFSPLLSAGKHKPKRGEKTASGPKSRKPDLLGAGQSRYRFFLKPFRPGIGRDPSRSGPYAIRSGPSPIRLQLEKLIPETSRGTIFRSKN